MGLPTGWLKRHSRAAGRWQNRDTARKELRRYRKAWPHFVRSGTEVLLPHALCLLAEAYGEAGRLDDGLSALTEALAAAEEHEIRQYEAETHRLKGELLLKQDHSNVAEAQTCFQRAVEIARKQSAKSLELRATTSLARLLAKQGQRDEARTMLAEIYGWFTEGFDTADLKDAKALLDELSG